MEQALTLFGNLDTPLPVADVAAMLRGATIAAKLRESSHFTGGAYIRIRENGRVHMTVERTSAGDYVVRGDADRGEELDAVARRVSGILALIGVRHRFELYSDDERMVAYLDHAWPLGEGSAEG